MIIEHAMTVVNATTQVWDQAGVEYDADTLHDLFSGVLDALRLPSEASVLTENHASLAAAVTVARLAAVHGVEDELSVDDVIETIFAALALVGHDVPLAA